MRIGHGYDVHRFADNRKLIIGGVSIEYEKGLLGHSDADVLTHAVMDALLGAAGLESIGYYFPDTVNEYKGADSLMLLKTVNEMIGNNGYKIVNIDSTVIAQQPKLAPYIAQIRRTLSYALSISENDVNVKATTEERLGFTGRIEGIAAHAVCLLEKK